MKRVLIIALLYMLTGISASGQPCNSAKDWGPDKVVEHILRLGTQGELLTAEGWNKAAIVFFSIPSPVAGDKVSLIRPKGDDILVMSNDWGIISCQIDGESARVVVEYYDDGRIDSIFHYTPGKQPGPIGKTNLVFTLILAPTHRVTTYKPIGNNFEYGPVVTGPPAWQITSPQGPRFTTVNTAIRYVLEAREKTKDPKIRKNARIP